MNLKTYRAGSIAEAVGQIKKDLGPDAVILHTRTTKQGGWFGFGARPIVEVTASSSVNVPGRRGAKKKLVAERADSAPSSNKMSGVAAADRAPAAIDVLELRSSSVRNAVLRDEPAPEATSSDAEAVAVANRDMSIGEDLRGDLVAIKQLVGRVLQTTSASAQPVMPQALFDRYLRLIESEVAREIADDVAGAVRDELTTEELACEDVVHQAVLRRLESLIKVEEDVRMPGRMHDGRPLTIALVGPTGVGKTTTIAKLAATYKLRHGKSVGLLTCDTYRIAAVEQLRTYANIIGLPLSVALTPGELKNACEALSGVDVLLIDTAGRSQHDSGRLDELGALLEAARPHETHLVLSSASSQAVMLRSAERFASVKPNRVIFTKLDEAVNFGVLVNAASRIDAELSFVTTGQEVPDHIERGRPDRLARLVLDGAGVR